MRLLIFLLAFQLTIPCLVAAQVAAPTTHERVWGAENFIEESQVDDNQVEIVIESPPSDFATWRFWIIAPDATSDLIIRSLENGDEVNRIYFNQAQNGVWSPYSSLKRVYMILPQASRAEIKLIGVPIAATDAQTPVGTLNIEQVSERHLTFDLNRLTEAVGRLSVLEGVVDTVGSANHSEVFRYCTAFLISPRIAVTAEHCVSRGLDGRFSELILGLLDEAKPYGVGRHSVELFAKSRAFDLAILSVSPPAGSQKYFDIAPNEPTADTEVLILQHFGAEPLSISDDEECHILDINFEGPPYIGNGELKRIPNARFGHGCDTTKSSSGAPVIDRESLRLVGVHQVGYGVGEMEINRALRRDRLVEFLTSLNLIESGN